MMNALAVQFLHRLLTDRATKLPLLASPLPNATLGLQAPSRTPRTTVAAETCPPRRRSGEWVRERRVQPRRYCMHEPLSPTLSPLVPRGERGRTGSSGAARKMRPFWDSSCFFLASLSPFCHSPAGPAYVECALSSYEGVDMSYTVQYLQSEMAAQGLEVSVLVNCLVQDDIQLGASDLHIEPWENAIAVRARVNGVLIEVAHLPLDLMDKVSMRFKVTSNLVTYQAGMPQDGTAVGGPELDGVQLRVSIFPTTRGEKIVVRLFDPKDRRFDLNTLGFEDSTLHGLLRLLKRTSGLLLFTGPTGSGKTSTMYSSLCYIMQRDGTSVSISTVEDPVEFN